MPNIGTLKTEIIIVLAKISKMDAAERERKGGAFSIVFGAE